MSINHFIPKDLLPYTNMDDGLNSEMISGRILRTPPVCQEGRRLCFLIGTLLSDHLRGSGSRDRIIFGPALRSFNSFTAFTTDLMTCSGEDVRFAVNILPEKEFACSFLDKAFAYRDAGALEYWLIDLPDQFVYCYDFSGGLHYDRRSFDQPLFSSCYPGFSCCLSDIMMEDGGSLQELTVFSRYKKHLFPDGKDGMLSDQCGLYQDEKERLYTADQFYHWIASRSSLPAQDDFAELLSGSIALQKAPAFRHQYIQGNLYFSVRSFLQSRGREEVLCFAPLSVEFSGAGILDSVVRPDLFMISSSEKLESDVFRGVPLWIVEIAEPGSAVQTYIDKAQIYSYHGVPEYWIINDWKKQVLVLGAGKEPVIRSYQDTISLDALPGYSITPEDIF